MYIQIPMTIHNSIREVWVDTRTRRKEFLKMA